MMPSLKSTSTLSHHHTRSTQLKSSVIHFYTISNALYPKVFLWHLAYSSISFNVKRWTTYHFYQVRASCRTTPTLQTHKYQHCYWQHIWSPISLFSNPIGTVLLSIGRVPEVETAWGLHVYVVGECSLKYFLFLFQQRSVDLLLLQPYDQK